MRLSESENTDVCDRDNLNYYRFITSFWHQMQPYNASYSKPLCKKCFGQFVSIWEENFTVDCDLSFRYLFVLLLARITIVELCVDRICILCCITKWVEAFVLHLFVIIKCA